MKAWDLQHALSFADRTFAGRFPARGAASVRDVGTYWPLYYMPACFQHFFAAD